MKRFALAWMAAFVAVTALLYAMQSMMIDWPVWFRGLTVSGFMVALMQKIIMPAVIRITA